LDVFSQRPFVAQHAMPDAWYHERRENDQGGSSPTLWPLLDDEIRAKLAFECLEEENRRLKDIVV